MLDTDNVTSVQNTLFPDLPTGQTYPIRAPRMLISLRTTSEQVTPHCTPVVGDGHRLI